MTIDRFIGSIVLGMVVGWATMHAGFDLYTAASYVISGTIDPGLALAHVGLTGAIIAYLLFRN